MVIVDIKMLAKHLDMKILVTPSELTFSREHAERVSFRVPMGGNYYFSTTELIVLEENYSTDCAPMR